MIAFGQGRLGDTQAGYEETLATFERIGDAEQVAAVHNLLAGLFDYVSDETLAWRKRPTKTVLKTADGIGQRTEERDSGGGTSAEGSGPAFGRELVDGPMRMRREAEQHVLEVREGRDVDQLAALDE